MDATLNWSVFMDKTSVYLMDASLSFIEATLNLRVWDDCLLHCCHGHEIILCAFAWKGRGLGLRVWCLGGGGSVVGTLGVRTGSWTGPPRGERAPRLGISSTVFGVRVIMPSTFWGYNHAYRHYGHPTRCEITPVILHGLVSPETSVWVISEMITLQKV